MPIAGALGRRHRGAVPRCRDLVRASPWLSLQPDSGVAGSTLVAKADPTGLALGVYRDTVIIAATTVSGQVMVPVLFRIH